MPGGLWALGHPNGWALFFCLTCGVKGKLVWGGWGWGLRKSKLGAWVNRITLVFTVSCSAVSDSVTPGTETHQGPRSSEYSGLISFRIDWFIWPQKNQMFDLKLCPHTNCVLPLPGAKKSEEQVHPLPASWSSWWSSEVDGWESLP